MNEKGIKLLFGERLKQARQMAGFSLRALSDKIGGAVSHNALAKYERGEMMPDGTLLISLASVLQQDAGFFFRQMEPDIQQVQYRAKREKLSTKDLAVIKAKAQEYFERYSEMESILGMQKPFKNPLAKGSITSSEDIEKAAVHLREAWNLGLQPIGNLLEVLEFNNVKVCEIKAHPEFDGFSGWMGKSPVVVINGLLNNQCQTRKRHTIMHELGHLLLKGRIARNLPEEKVVAHFAGAFILPASSARKVLGGHRESMLIKELIEIKVVWGISLSSLMMRAHQLGLISQALYGRFWDKYKEEHWKDKEPGDENYIHQESVQRFQRLVLHGLSEARISHSKAASLLNCSIDEIRDGGPRIV